MRWLCILLLCTGSLSGAAAPLVFDPDRFVSLTLVNGLEVSGRIIDAGDGRIHLVRAGFNRTIALADLSDPSLGTLGLTRKDLPAATATPVAAGGPTGLDATRDRLRSALEKYERHLPQTGPSWWSAPVLVTPLWFSTPVYCPRPWGGGIHLEIGF